MKNIILGIFAIVLSGGGFYFIINSFFTPLKIIKGKKKYKKLIIKCFLGVLMLFVSGLIIIYFVSLQDSGKDKGNLKKEEIIEELPDISQH